MYTFNGNILTVDNKWLGEQKAPVLPPYTIRARFTQGFVPDEVGEYRELYDAENNIWDLYIGYEYQWTNIFGAGYANLELIEIIAANPGEYIDNTTEMCFDCPKLEKVALFDMSNIRRTIRMFNWCPNLKSVPFFDTSNCIDMTAMFACCLTLETVPLFDTSKCTKMDGMFEDCPNVKSGALALYRQASSQATVPSHSTTFRDCGINTPTGSAELAQIPNDWK